MRETFFKLIKAYLLQAIEAVSGLDFYQVVVEDIEKQKSTKVWPIYEQLKKQIEDKEYMAALSIPEKHALGRNEINFKKVLREMDDAVTHLTKHKWSGNTRTALWLLDDTQIFVEAILANYELADKDSVVKPKQLLNAKKFNNADYLEKINITQTAISTLADIVEEQLGDDEEIQKFIAFSLVSSMTKTIAVLKREYEDREANGAPDLFTFDIPELEEPEIPEEAPEPKKDAEQLEMKLEVPEGVATSDEEVEPIK